MVNIDAIRKRITHTIDGPYPWRGISASDLKLLFDEIEAKAAHNLALLEEIAIHADLMTLVDEKNSEIDRLEKELAVIDYVLFSYHHATYDLLMEGGLVQGILSAYSNWQIARATLKELPCKK